MDVVKLASPRYMAVMGWGLAGPAAKRGAGVHCAEPTLLTATPAAPPQLAMATLLSRNSIKPVGAADPLASVVAGPAVAVKVTPLPNWIGEFWLAVRVVVVAVVPILKEPPDVITAEVVVVKFSSPDPAT